MSIERITFNGTDPKVKSNSTQKQETTKTSLPNTETHPKTHATQYMIGATTLAAVIAVGILGHNKGWWSKFSKNISTKSDSMDNSENKASQIITNINNDINHSIHSKEEIHTPKLNENEPQNYVSDFDLYTSTPLKKNILKKDGKTLDTILEFDPKSGNLLKQTMFQKDGKTVAGIIECDPTTGKALKHTVFQQDGKTLDYITDYDTTTGMATKNTYYQKDGKTVDCIIDYNPNSGLFLKQTFFQKDGKTVDYIIEHNADTGKALKKTYYNNDGSILNIENL